MSTTAVTPQARSMSVLHAVAVGAAVLGFIFILCWAGEAVGFVPSTHRFVSIFTANAETSSVSALGEGLPLALAFGAIAGASLAFFANLFQFLDRR